MKKKKCLFVEDLFCSGIIVVFLCINYIYKKCCFFVDYMFVFVFGVDLFYFKILIFIFFYLILFLVDCVNVVWKDGNFVILLVSNYGSCCDTILLVVCLWFFILIGKYEFVFFVFVLWF